MTQKSLFWFRRDLRIDDNPALVAACRESDIVIPVYLDFESELGWRENDRHRWWRLESVKQLAERLESLGSKLIIREGRPEEVLPSLVEKHAINAVFWNRHFRPSLTKQDTKLRESLEPLSVEPNLCEGNFLHHPEEVETTSGGPYHVYTPFWNKFQKTIEVGPPAGSPAIERLDSPEPWPRSESVGSLEPDNGRLDDYWTPGQRAGHERFDYFLENLVESYESNRDRPDLDGTSRISPYLRWGEISLRRMWHQLSELEAQIPGAENSIEAYKQELVWREFAYHLLYHYPETAEEPLKDKFKAFRWRNAPTDLSRWMRGETGYPLVDAGMRQLIETGWMHNRVRMVVASFLTKDLRIHWLEGAKWFWENLVDADLANNTMGWQWAGGCGADAQPFFRIFNPVKQGKDYDPDGEYIRTYVPELRNVSDDVLHTPWKADDVDYPDPIVDHDEARKAAMAEWERIK